MRDHPSFKTIKNNNNNNKKTTPSGHSPKGYVLGPSSRFYYEIVLAHAVEHLAHAVEHLAHAAKHPEKRPPLF